MDTSQDLDTLAGLAAQADQVGSVSAPENVPGAPGAPAAEPGHAEQAADAVNMFAGLIVSYAPAAADIWTPEARQNAAMAMEPVFEKYGWSMTRIPPELTAAIVVGPLLYRSSQVVAEKIKADRQANARAPAAGAAAPVPGATETGEAPAAPVHPQMALYGDSKP